ncbi:GNAT family acetyltransferase [Heyndrickxia shackletonii]|uniref:GNAT family acetyltransferase n=1 Tax=Heyndrickxia shackletonii TaxID=157838 RepID=A0A0Q3WP19_9BACI|nr:GNAT family N-acetyltransferase [Heyndrickxia shackletonii]KQL52399.1 GNAT family acetyltransferase [Heyndrickxia shackletonii]NEY99043.1 GNAT family N-acetyltransferase [Heyndrickxia shackletonii]
MKIRPYQIEDEQGWVRCRVLSFLDTAYFDNVLKEKEIYENPAMELVAEEEGQIVGLIDIEYEIKERTVCSRGTGLGGMIWHIAVHPDFRREGIGTKLLNEAERIAKNKGLNRLEAWTRDDEWVNKWYVKNGFTKVESYLHVYIDGGNDLKETIKSEMPNLFPVQAFAHYVGEDVELVKKKFNRVHECVCYEKMLE